MEIKIPVREHGESDIDYIYRYGCAVREYNNALCHAMDRNIIGADYSAQPKDISGNTGRERELRARLTMADYLADRPHLVAEMKAGKWSPFEI